MRQPSAASPLGGGCWPHTPKKGSTTFWDKTFVLFWGAYHACNPPRRTRCKRSAAASQGGQTGLRRRVCLSLRNSRCSSISASPREPSLEFRVFSVELIVPLHILSLCFYTPFSKQSFNKMNSQKKTFSVATEKGTRDRRRKDQVRDLNSALFHVATWCRALLRS